MERYEDASRITLTALLRFKTEAAVVDKREALEQRLFCYRRMTIIISASKFRHLTMRCVVRQD